MLADSIQLALPAFVAFIVGLIAYSLGTRYGQEAVLRMDTAPARILTGVLAVVGVGVLVYAVGARSTGSTSLTTRPTGPPSPP